MPTYLYETIPLAPDDAVEQFEVRQRFDDTALSLHPTTGAPVRRVISGGLGVLTRSEVRGQGSELGPACGPQSCTCGRFE